MLDDDLGIGVRLPTVPRRVVSLVPSLTETVALSAPGRLIGATAWCTHPPDLRVTRVGGTKNPDLDRIAALNPDLVLANEEENRPQDLLALRDRGVPLWVTDIRSIPQALESLGRVLSVLDAPHRGWLDQARLVWTTPPRVAERPIRALIPIWRRPWMALGSDTYAGDLLARLGVHNVLADHTERYPKADLAQVPDRDLVVLPDEPYRFTVGDGPEAFPQHPCALVDGRSLTWYGPALVAAADRLVDAIRTALPGAVKE